MRNILVIDADKSTHAEVQSSLAGLGFRVLHSPNGECGLRTLDETHVDLVVADMRASTRDGVEVIRALRRRLPEGKIIALSGSALIHATEFESVVNHANVIFYYRALRPW